jgi:hypothetical protein
VAPSAVDHGIRWACFGSWAACALWAALRRPAGAASELWAAAISTALVPVLHGALNGDWLWRAAARGHWPLFWVDAIALAMAFGFARLASPASAAPATAIPTASGPTEPSPGMARRYRCGCSSPG